MNRSIWQDDSITSVTVSTVQDTSVDEVALLDRRENDTFLTFKSIGENNTSNIHFFDSHENDSFYITGMDFENIERLDTIMPTFRNGLQKIKSFEAVKDYESTFNMPSSEFIKKWNQGEINPTPAAFEFASLHRIIFNGQE